MINKLHIILFGMLSISAFAGEGPTNDLKDVPKGMKLVPLDDDCKHKDPCEKEKKELDKLKKEMAKIQADNAKLRKDNERLEFQTECTQKEPEIKTIYRTKEVKVPVEKIVEREISKDVPVYRKNIFRILGAIGQDGLVTESSPTDPYAEDAEVYYNGLAGVGYTRFFDDFGLGVFGMIGGTSKMIGASAEIAF